MGGTRGGKEEERGGEGREMKHKGLANCVKCSINARESSEKSATV